MGSERQRRIAVLIVVVLIASAGVALIGGGSRKSGSRPGSPGAAATTLGHPATSSARAPTTDPPTTAAAEHIPSAVGLTAVTTVREARRFGVEVLYPATQGGPGAPPLLRGRPYPLIVFSPGFDIAPDAYRSLVAHWAALGFVVAEPDYPFTSPGTPGGLNEADILQHPADLQAVIDRILAVSAGSDGALAGMVDPARIGVAGHSDGGDVTDAVVADSCCRDHRVRAAAVLSGAELTSFAGTYGPPGVPLLVIQGDADDVNPPECSEQIYATAVAPRFYLGLHGAGHLPPYTADPAGGTYHEAVDRVTGLFWQAYLGGDTAASGQLQDGGGLGPQATLTAGGPVTRVGSCPGAPG